MYLPLAESDPCRAPLLRVMEYIGHTLEAPELVLFAWRELGLSVDAEPTLAGIWGACSPITWTWESFGDVAFYGDSGDPRYLSHVALVVGHQLVMTSEPWVRIERPRYRADFIGCGRLSFREFGA